MEEAGTVRSPCEVIKVCRFICSYAASLEGRSVIESGVDTSLVVIVGETIKPTMEVNAVPAEEGPIEILPPKSADHALAFQVHAMETLRAIIAMCPRR